MLEYFIENWYLAVILILVIALTVYVIIKAWQAASKTSKEREAALKKAEYEEKVVKEFRDLTVELAESSDAKRLFDGTALNIQRVLEKETYPDSKFNELNSEQKIIYAMYYYLDDTKKGLSEFYKCNGKPLTPWALEGIKEFLPENAKAIAVKEYDAFDPDNEEVSCTADVLSKLDAEYEKAMQNVEIYEELKAFIIANIKEF